MALFRLPVLSCARDAPVGHSRSDEEHSHFVPLVFVTPLLSDHSMTGFDGISNVVKRNFRVEHIYCTM